MVFFLALCFLLGALQMSATSIEVSWRNCLRRVVAVLSSVVVVAVLSGVVVVAAVLSGVVVAPISLHPLVVALALRLPLCYLFIGKGVREGLKQVHGVSEIRRSDFPF